ncbi:MAG: leucine-rich repeat domain-containing protein [Ruminiclostridium sp.]|nr:leucine-rich repeat domain-containing protein [Ruminiclostridium sp.]
MSVKTNIKTPTRKLFLALTILLCTAMLFCPVQAEYIDNDTETKEPLTWDKWLYYDMGDYISICGYTGTDDRIVTPTEINGKKVTKISPRETKIDFFDVTTYTFFEAYNKNTSEVVISEGVVSLDRYAFYGQTMLKSVILPESLKYIGGNAFEGCEDLTSITVPENVTAIGACAFANSGLTEIFLPEGLKIIGGSAFADAPITQLYIPDSVIYVGSYAFSHSKLEEITLPGGLVKLEDDLLCNCISLKRAYIGEGIVWPGRDMFNTCPNLEEVYFPSTLRGTEQIFRYNRSLKNIYFAADEKECGEILGNNIMDDLTGKSSGSVEEVAEYYDNVKIGYNTPVPLPAHSPYPKRSKEIDKTAVLLIAITLLCFTLTAVFVILFAAGKKREAAIKAEEKKKKEDGFRPEVLGTWECARCKTLNSPIGNYCYKCGRKR